MKPDFRLLWTTVQLEQEIFAYVLNRASNGDHYWVFAHVTPTFDQSGAFSGYHSNRRVPDQHVVGSVIKPMYRELLDIEDNKGARHRNMDVILHSENLSAGCHP